MWNVKPDGYPIPVRNPTGTGTNFYPQPLYWWAGNCSTDLNPTRCHPYGGEVEDDWRSRAIGGPFFRHPSDHRWRKTKLTPKPVSLGWVWLQPGCKIKATAAPIGCETYMWLESHTRIVIYSFNIDGTTSLFSLMKWKKYIFDRFSRALLSTNN
jgi:hypothetical protein